MKKLYGNTGGLKSNQIKRLENFYRRRIPPEFIITPELARDMSRISRELRRQIGVLINRLGKVTHIIVGSYNQIMIPDISEYRTDPGRLKGLRCIHTHLNKEPLTTDDLTDLALLQLDVIAAIITAKEGLPQKVHLGHLLPGSTDDEPYQLLPPLDPGKLDIGCLELIKALETELSTTGVVYDAGVGTERTLLVSVTTAEKKEAIESLAELEELALSCDLQVLDSVLQLRKQIDSKYLIGRGKLSELTILALKKGATMIIFDQELNPSQIRSITDRIDLKVIDRTQLILDIFAQRAQTREGKLQVELAQLKYLFPRLMTKNTALSRLTGGIGGRGPGETKLEIDRRRVRDRITKLEKEISFVVKHRNQQKAKRKKRGVPIISIIGYTNAGKSTLLNTLTKSRIHTENKMFATLDPSNRRLKFPKNREVIITDTVGFIRDLPKELMVAFKATLEELENADVFLHVIDISNPRFQGQIQSVCKILSDLNLNKIPVIYVLNKKDLIKKETITLLTRTLHGIPISAINRSTLMPLIEKMEALIQQVV